MKTIEQINREFEVEFLFGGKSDKQIESNDFDINALNLDDLLDCYPCGDLPDFDGMAFEHFGPDLSEPIDGGESDIFKDLPPELLSEIASELFTQSEPPAKDVPEPSAEDAADLPEDSFWRAPEGNPPEENPFDLADGLSEDLAVDLSGDFSDELLQELLDEIETAEKNAAAGKDAGKKNEKSEPQKADGQESSGKKKNGAVKYISNFLFYFAIASILFVALSQIVNNSESTGGPPRGFLGYTYFTVLTGSMQSEIPKGSLIVTRDVDENEIVVGDNITYLQDDDSTITHQVVEIYENYQDTGRRGFKTWGIENPNPDEDIVMAANVVGVVKTVVPELGWTLSYISNNLIKVFILFGIFIAVSIALQVFFNEKKKEREALDKLQEPSRQGVAC